MGCLEIGKRPAGIGEKPSDRWAVPLCADCHLNAPDAQHNVGEPAFWKRVGIDPFDLSAKLYAQLERRQNRTPTQRKAVVARAVRRKRTHSRAHKLGRKMAKPPKRRWASRPFPPGRKFDSRRKP